MVEKLKVPIRVESSFEPMGDQITSIESLAQGVVNGKKHQVLKGATGTGKTFVIAKMLERLSELQKGPRPVLILSPNKTLAAQLYGEFKDFLPDNAVTYFVSYYDYYQPESYLPEYDKLIEKETSINDEIDRYRNETTRSLIERKDVIVIASVSCIYGLGSPEYYEGLGFLVELGQNKPRDTILRQLIDIQYERNDQNLERGSFRAKGDRIEIYPSYEWNIVQIDMFGDTIESIKILDPLNRNIIEEKKNIFILPAKQYVMPEEVMLEGLESIEKELQERLISLNQEGKIVEAQRLKQRTSFDLEMLRTTGFCSGIENYSAHFDGRIRQHNYKVNKIPPSTLIDFFPENEFLLLVDESHVALPQVQGMLLGDRARKKNLIDYGFRLPSAFDNRPLSYNEFFKKINQAVYISATPGDRELSFAGDSVIEQVIRPTGLLDPEVVIKSTQGQIDDLLEEIRVVLDRKERVLVTTLTKKMAEHLTEYLQDAGVTKTQYLHSDINTLERNKILRDLRLGKIEVLVGINLLREGLDLPEVALVTIFDADKEGFLRTTRSLIQIMGRASRNVKGRVILYADKTTNSMQAAIDETNHRRETQKKFNIEHGITPETIIKSVKEYALARESAKIMDQISVDVFENDDEFEELMHSLQQQMRSFAEQLEFEKAAKLRDQINELKASRKPQLATIEKEI
ncbi:MAG: UvrABC system protein B [Candidatus Heimdallarchaeota archaeon LC_3]|nr:MAG: UvrABC system protein B [Candidatus Heimdallarchaeota archaeon LC_3]